MRLKLHANATTTPRTRAYIQNSPASCAELSRELGISQRTVERWRGRQGVADRSSRPHEIATKLTPLEEQLCVELRTTVDLSLDDLVEVMKRCVNPELSRSAIHRCLQRHGVSSRPKPEASPKLKFETPTPAGFVHVDVKYLPPLNRRRSYAYVAIDRATRFAYVEILPDRKAETAAGFLERFLQAFPLKVHTLLTDNGSEFTDRFAVDKKGKPEGRPSGDHLFDLGCRDAGIQHRLTKPFSPQTNGMVERFNRRISEHLAQVRYGRAAHHRSFIDHRERDAYLLDFVQNYNRTRLRCLGYTAPLEILNNLTGHNTEAGAQGRLAP
ncbi:MAG TPA: IS481 family transposase [Caulobacteraceae bacterium]